MDWEFLNYGASLGFTLALLPQLSRTLKLRRADDISRRFLVLVLASAAMMMVYSLSVQNWAFAAAQVANLAVWGIVLYYRIRPRSAFSPGAGP